MIYPLVREMTEATPRRPVVTVAGRVLGFTRQAYHRWLRHPVSQREEDDLVMVAAIREIHDQEPQFGHRLICDELRDQGFTASERRVWRVCSKYRVFARLGRQHSRKSRPARFPAEDDLVRRSFTASSPNRLWLTDITEHHTREGKLYLCAVKDVWSNRIIGWSIGSRMRTELAVAALADAWNRRGRPEKVIIHSDRGGQFGSRKYVRVCRLFQITRSMGQARTCADNAAMESFFSLLQKNVLNQKRHWDTRRELRAAIITWIEATYNRRRRQRRLGITTPVEYETINADKFTLAA